MGAAADLIIRANYFVLPLTVNHGAAAEAIIALPPGAGARRGEDAA